MLPGSCCFVCHWDLSQDEDQMRKGEYSVHVDIGIPPNLLKDGEVDPNAPVVHKHYHAGHA